MKKIFICSLSVFLVTVLIINPDKSIIYAKDGLELCRSIIIPSLFPFFVCSGLLVYSGFCELLSKLSRPVMRPIFNINPSGSAAFILGLISGYPLGAVTTCQLYNSMYISKSEAERLLAFCNNSGPLFILGAVGVSMYHSPRIGIILYTAHILGAVSVGITFRFYKPNSYCAPQSNITAEQKPLSEIFSTVLTNSVQSILTVCGCVIFCSVISKLVIDMLCINSTFKALLSGCTEFVSGLSQISYLDIPLFSKLLMSAGVCAFAGISVHLQVMSVAAKSGLDLKPYIFGKILHAVFAIFYTCILLKFLPGSVTASYITDSSSISAGFFICSVYSLLSVITVTAMILIYLIGKSGKCLKCKKARIKE